MKVLWLGQAGLLFVSGKRKVMVDPYLTNSLSFIDYTLDRQIPVNKKVFSVSPDVMVLTNCHPDHADIDTISKFAKKQKNKLTILSCESVFLEIADCGYCAIANNIMLEPGSEWTVDGFNILAVTAKTDDRSAIGVIITDTQNGKKYYVTGDTLYSNQVLQDLPSDIYAVFLPINGEYGSMNMLDAKRFALQIGARHVVPLHFGMFDQIDPNAFDIENKIIPQPYKIIDFEDEEILADNKLLDRKFNERPATYEKIAKAEEADKDLAYDEADSAHVIDSEAVTTELDKEAEATIEELDVVENEATVEEADMVVGETNEDATEDAEASKEDTVEVEIYEGLEDEGLEERDSAPLEGTEASNEEASEENCFNDFENEPEADCDEVTITAENMLENEDVASNDCENEDIASETEIEATPADLIEVETIESEEIMDTTEDDADIEGDEVVDDEYGEPLYDDFDDFDESDEDYEERKSQVFEPFTPEELMSYASYSSDTEDSDTEDTNEDFGQDVDENELDTTKDNTSEDVEPSEVDEGSTEEETIDYSFSDFDDEPVVSEDEAQDVKAEEVANDAVEEADEVVSEPAEEASEVEGEAVPPESTYISKPTNDDTDDADKIDAYVKELEKLDRGETPKF